MTETKAFLLIFERRLWKRLAVYKSKCWAVSISCWSGFVPSADTAKNGPNQNHRPPPSTKTTNVQRKKHILLVLKRITYFLKRPELLSPKRQNSWTRTEIQGNDHRSGWRA